MAQPTKEAPSGESPSEPTGATPRKYIEDDHSRVEVFRRSAAFRKILAYLQGCAEAVEGTPGPTGLDAAAVARCCPAVRFLVEDYFPQLERLVEAIPLEAMAQQRFGNRAKREFHARLNATVEADMLRLARALPGKGRVPLYGYDPAMEGKMEREREGEGEGRDPAALRALARELAAYVRDAFGNATRLDYGTGHELHFFLVLLICLEESGDAGGSLRDDGGAVLVPSEVGPPKGVPAERREAVRALRREYVLHAFPAYLRLVRRLQRHYSLEPAGSHGAWGLDDYHHIPYIFGAAQLIGQETATPPILPVDVCSKEKVKAYEGEYLYFSMIMWILQNKAGPFSEHSNMLYNISGVEKWAKVYGGMVKMYAAEVLAKFNVTQHLLFGPHLPWNTKTLDESPSVEKK